MHAPLAILGGGPGGYAAAFLAADAGLDVTLIDEQPRLGGTCLLSGCIPSKALLHVARVLAEVDELREQWGVEFSTPRIDLEQLRSRKEKIIATLSKGLAQLAKRRKVRLIRARGILESSTVLRLEREDASPSDDSMPEDGRLTFDHLILATGSSPAVPPSLAVDSPRVMTSADALELTVIPGTLLVIGGGYIGLELGTVYAQLGAKVSVVEMTGGLLPGVDRDLVKPLHKRLKQQLDDRIFLNTKVEKLEADEHGVDVTFQGDAKSGVERFDRVLIAVGRRPRTDNLGLETTLARCDDRGFVVCDDVGRTADEHILAVGDASGEPMLAHKASHQAKAAVNALLGKSPPSGNRIIPAVVFTDPEIAWAGLTADQAKAEGRSVKASLYPWAASGRAQALGRTEGLTKWIVDPDTDRLLGCGLVGSGAGELIAEAVLALEKQCTVDEVAGAVHPHPTLSETLMNAAEVYLGTAAEVYKPRR